jgi:hypothetical protein
MNCHLKLTWLLVLVGSLMATGCIGRSASKTFSVVGAGTSATGSGAALDAVKLCDEYQAGAQVADDAYKDRTVSLKGSIKNVRDDRVSGKKYLELKGSDEGGVGTRNVRCYFTDEFQDQIAKLKPGEEVKVQGTCKGKQGTADNFDVAVEKCKLLK